MKLRILACMCRTIGPISAASSARTPHPRSGRHPNDNVSRNIERGPGRWNLIAHSPPVLGLRHLALGLSPEDSAGVRRPRKYGTDCLIHTHARAYAHGGTASQPDVCTFNTTQNNLACATTQQWAHICIRPCRRLGDACAHVLRGRRPVAVDRSPVRPHDAGRDARSAPDR